MKGNRSLGNAGNKGTLRAIAYGPWAAYIVRFIQAYAAAGIPISALTPQNEPGVATRYPGMNMTPGSIATWISQDLVPALARAKLNATIYGQDIGWGSPALAHAAIKSRAARDLAGLAWHCYFGSPDVMGALHQKAPSYTQIVDECSPGISAIPTSEVVISSLRDWASTVALWNIALDPKGGPVQAPNSGCPRCYGLATINEATGGVRLTRAFFQLGQASAAIQPGARRVSSNNFVSYSYLRPNVNFVGASLDDVAAVNPDGSRVLLAYDNGSEPIRFAVAWHGTYFQYTIPAGATVTFKWNRPAPG
jgi:glucosylceramidase